MRSCVSVVKRTALYLLALLVYEAILFALGVTCPIYAVFGVKCPTCGVSRAVIALLSFDVQGYISYQPLAIPLLIAVWLMINADFFKRKMAVYAISLAILVSNFVFYILRWII